MINNNHIYLPNTLFFFFFKYRKNKAPIDRGVNFVSLGFYYYKRKDFEKLDYFLKNAEELFETGYKSSRLGVCRSLDLIGKLFEKLEDDYYALLMYKKSFLIKRELAQGIFLILYNFLFL